MISHISYSTTFSNHTHFQANSKSKAMIDELSEEDNTKHENEKNIEKELNEES